MLVRFRLMLSLLMLGMHWIPSYLQTVQVQLDLQQLMSQGLQNLIVVDLYKANKKLCTIITLGQGKSPRMALLRKRKMMIIPKD